MDMYEKMSTESGNDGMGKADIFVSLSIVKKHAVTRYRRLEDARVLFELGGNYLKQLVSLLENKQISRTELDLFTKNSSALMSLIQYNQKSLEDEIIVQHSNAEILYDFGHKRIATGHPQPDEIAGYNVLDSKEIGSSRGQPDGEQKDEISSEKTHKYHALTKHESQLVQAIYDFERLNMTLTKGEVCFLLNKTDDDWWFVRNGSGRDGYVPSKFIKEIEDNHNFVQHTTLLDNDVPKIDLLVQPSSVNKCINNWERSENNVSDVPKREPDGVPAFYVNSKSPNAMYFRTSDMQNWFLTLHRRMQEYYQHADKPKGLQLKRGSPCVVYFDNEWHRAVITKDLGNTHSKMVKFVDKEASIYRVSKKHIYTLAHEFEGCDLLKCSLDGIFPSSHDGVWGEEDRNFIAERLLVAEDIRISRKGVQMSMYGATFVSLHYKSKGNWINLNEEFITSGPSLGLPNPIRNLFAWKPSWKASEPPELNSTFKGKVTCISSTGELTLHVVTKPQSKVDEIRNHLTAVYKFTQPTKLDLNCRPGDLCIARYVDKNWYRAIVKEIDESEGEVKVLFVDYGSLEWIDSHGLRLNIILQEVPIQAIRCVLHNIRPLNVQHSPNEGRVAWPVETLDYIEELTIEKQFHVHVLKRGPLVGVSLNIDQNCISAKLVNKQMAEYINPF